MRVSLEPAGIVARIAAGTGCCYPTLSGGRVCQIAASIPERLPRGGEAEGAVRSPI